MNSTENFTTETKKKFSFDPVYAVIFLSAAVFIVIFGVKVINPFYTGWYGQGDMGQHYFGWKLFRSSKWMLMPGMMNTADYPFSASVVFTDSIPAAALFFKLFRGILPSDFQYFGMWGLLCFILQGIFAYRIITEEVRCEDNSSRITAVASTLIFTTAPVLVKRMFWHTALASNWLILLAVYVFLMREKKFAGIGKAMTVWALIGALGASVHVYYLALCGIVLIGFILDDIINNKRFFAAVLPLLSYVASAAAVLFALGAFSSGMDTGAPGLGYYSFNLLSFFNPDSFSMFLLNWTYCEDGQYEGFAYLGLGVIILLVPAVDLFFVHRLYRRPKAVSAMIIFLISVTAAASNEITAGKYIIVKFELDSIIEKVWSSFRASGRLVWDAMYLLMLAAVVINLKYSKTAVRGKRFSAMQRFLLICVVIQLVDILPGIYTKHRDISWISDFSNVLKADVWQDIADEGKVKHIVFIDKDKLSGEELYSFADYASDNGMTINDYYFSRSLKADTDAIAADFAHNPADDCIYIFTEEQADLTKEFRLNYTEADDFIIGTKITEE